MADSLFDIAESLVAKLASRACEEASRVLGVYEDLQGINQTLSIVKPLLLDAEHKRRRNTSVSRWLEQLNKVFTDAEDLMDEIDYEALRQQAVKAHGTIITRVGSFFSSSNPVVFRSKMARKIKKIKERLDRVAADRQNFGLEIINADRRVVNRREMTQSHVIPSDIIGRENDKERIMELLMHRNTSDDGKCLSVLPIVGFGGVGKTTLAKLVFNDERIAESFQLKIWVCVSDCYDRDYDYDPESVSVDFKSKNAIIKIIDAASTFANAPIHQRNFDKLDMEPLKDLLRNKLANQKFLLVLDDVVRMDPVKWVELRDLIQVGAEGSKILVTTQSDRVASIMGTIGPCLLECLSEEDSLSLFVKWAFKGEAEKRYPYLMEIGKDIVKKCSGNPLALVTIGSLLFSNVDIDDWESVRDNDIWNIPGGIIPALRLCYDQLPSYLKQCFALFSLYPKDYVFDSFRVASLWGALGLLPSENSNQILKHGPNQYLKELHSRSFLEDFVDYGICSTFKLHNLVQSLAYSVVTVGTMDTFKITSNTRITSNITTSNIRRRPHGRHWSFPADWPLTSELNSKDARTHLADVRTILFPIAKVGASCRDFLNTFVARCKCLRFLDLSDSTYETLPQSIGKLKHLRYLSLENNKRFKKLPDSICKLHKLEVLILSGCTELEALPKGLRNLISLRHLEITTKLRVLPEDEIANLSALQTLRIELCQNMESFFGQTRLTSLKVLVVASCRSLTTLPLDIEHFPMLDTLLVDNCDKLELSEGHNDQNSNLKLKILHFVSLPKLVTLPQWLQGSVNTLQYLLISSCNSLAVLPEWLPIMKCLKTLYITNCPNMSSLPSGIHRLSTIERFVIDRYSELCRRSQPQVGECSHKHATIDEPEEIVEEEQELE